MHLHLALSCSLAAYAAFVGAQVVDLGYAQYQGVFSSNVTSFLGIRFAAPPTGSLRWQAPWPPAPTFGVQQAITTPPACNQGSAGENFAGNLLKRQLPGGFSEDCLFLSVYVSGELNSSASLPVVVWIHGGSYVEGWEALYDGTDLIEDAEGGVVVVTIQYRLGLFGFLAGSEVKAHGSLNAGLLDQNFALQWVQKYISRFGGNPAAVTIWGESAGAGSVLQHTVAHGGATDPPLFKAAITSSTYLPPQYNYNDSVPEALFADVASSTGCASSISVMDCLRATDVLVLDAVNPVIGAASFYGTAPFVPVVDGDFIVERPTETLKAGHANGDVLLSVTNTFEGTVFVFPITNSNISQYISELFPFLAPTQVIEATRLYTNIPGLTTSNDQAIAIIGESIFICPTYLLLENFPGPSWKGEFAIPPGVHGQDGPYYFANPVSTPETYPFYDNPVFIQAFSQSFLSVVKNDDPNKKINSSTITPKWLTWNISHTQMLFNSTDGVAENSLPVVKAINTDPALLKRCAFWQSVSAQTHQ